MSDNGIHTEYGHGDSSSDTAAQSSSRQGPSAPLFLAGLAALIVASTIAVVGRSLPYDLSTIAAGVTGIAAGLVVSRIVGTHETGTEVCGP